MTFLDEISFFFQPFLLEASGSCDHSRRRACFFLFFFSTISLLLQSISGDSEPFRKIFFSYFYTIFTGFFCLKVFFGPIFAKKNLCPIFQIFTARWRFWSEISPPEVAISTAFHEKKIWLFKIRSVF